MILKWTICGWQCFNIACIKKTNWTTVIEVCTSNKTNYRIATKQLKKSIFFYYIMKWWSRWKKIEIYYNIIYSIYAFFIYIHSISIEWICNFEIQGDYKILSQHQKKTHTYINTLMRNFSRKRFANIFSFISNRIPFHFI